MPIPRQDSIFQFGSPYYDDGDTEDEKEDGENDKKIIHGTRVGISAGHVEKQDGAGGYDHRPDADDQEKLGLIGHRLEYSNAARLYQHPLKAFANWR